MICWVVAVLYDAAIPSNNINNRVYAWYHIRYIGCHGRDENRWIPRLLQLVCLGVL